MKKKKNNILTLEQFKDKHYGIRGTKKRETLEAGYENFKIGALLQHIRVKKNTHNNRIKSRNNEIIYFNNGIQY